MSGGLHPDPSAGPKTLHLALARVALAGPTGHVSEPAVRAGKNGGLRRDRKTPRERTRHLGTRDPAEAGTSSKSEELLDGAPVRPYVRTGWRSRTPSRGFGDRYVPQRTPFAQAPPLLGRFGVCRASDAS